DLAWGLGDFELGHRLNGRAVARARALGAAGTLAWALENLTLQEMWRGNLALAEAYAAEGHRLALEAGAPHRARPPPTPLATPSPPARRWPACAAARRRPAAPRTRCWRKPRPALSSGRPPAPTTPSPCWRWGPDGRPRRSSTWRRSGRPGPCPLTTGWPWLPSP